VVAAHFRHDTSRALDPQLHTHFGKVDHPPDAPGRTTVDPVGEPGRRSVPPTQRRVQGQRAVLVRAAGRAGPDPVRPRPGDRPARRSRHGQDHVAAGTGPRDRGAATGDRAHPDHGWGRGAPHQGIGPHRHGAAVPRRRVVSASR
jgi:hypothetical protein